MTSAYDRYGLKATKVEVSQQPFDPSEYLEHLDVSERVREILRRGWRWEFVEMGGGIKTITAQMIHEKTDEELLSIGGMTTGRLRAVRKALTTAALSPNW